MTTTVTSTPCKVRRVVAALPNRTAARIETALNSASLTTSAVHRAFVAELGASVVSLSTVSRHRAGTCSCSDTAPVMAPVRPPKGWAAGSEWEGQSGTITSTPKTGKQLTDFDEILEDFGYDPAEVEIVGAVRHSRWQTYDGTWLTAYRLHVQSRTAAQAAVEPAWPVVQKVARVTIRPLRRKANAWSSAAAGNRVALLGSDTQIGYRIPADGVPVPFHDAKAMDIFVQVAELLQPNDLVIQGDFLDLAAQSRWPQEAGFARTTQLAFDAAYAWLAQLRAAAPHARMVIVEGNHDKRMQHFVEMNALSAFGLRKAGLPEAWPVMSLPNLLRLDELGVEYIDAYPAATIWLNPRTRLIHGTRSSARGSTMAAYADEHPHISTSAGHSHRAELIFRTTFDGNGPVESFGLNCGCLCRTDGAVPSVHGGQHADGSHAAIVENWQQGFGIIRYNADEAWPEVHRIVEGATVYDGKVLTAGTTTSNLELAA